MSARDELHRLAGTDRWSDEDYAFFECYLDAYAHEMAEKIRELAAHGEGDAMYRYGVRSAADEIDPEVKS